MHSIANLWTRNTVKPSYRDMPYPVRTKINYEGELRTYEFDAVAEVILTSLVGAEVA